MYTEQQLRAIEERDKNLLVSAAAGSGKTTVLVERIIGRILSDAEPIDIDRILVMTFTKAAAEQMKEKILKAIEDKRADDPTNRRLMRQATLVHNAKITTIHGFCLDVIRNHFQEIGLDPNFRVADEGECRLLKQDVINRVIESYYEAADSDFITMTEAVAAKKSDSAIEEILNRMYEFCMSDPSPEEWLNRCIEAYENVEVDSFSEQPYVRMLINSFANDLEDALNSAHRLYDMCNEPDGAYMYAKAVAEDIEIIEMLAELKTYDELQAVSAGIKFPMLGRAKKDAPVAEEIKEEAKNLRDSYKKRVMDALSKNFALPASVHVELIKGCRPVVRTLVNMTKAVCNEYAQAKREKNIVDFSDLEHLCIDILTAEDQNTASEYRDYFEEIYVDEYQDSNLVQEDLINCIKRENNLFMVGDVKQSIYSFRLARPELFMNKYRSYGDKGNGDFHSERIDLHHNFRSRESVLTSVNELFMQIMSSLLGGVDYDSAAALHPGAYYPKVSALNEKTELMLVGSMEELTDRELEAKAIAGRIKRLMKEQLVYDPTEDDKERMRPVKYSDIVILLRSAKGYDEQYKKVLEAEGIPVHVMSTTGYFSSMEVSILLDYLRVIDNPLQDIPMAAVLKSLFGGFSDEELAIIRICSDKGSLYDTIKFFASIKGNDEEVRVLTDRLKSRKLDLVDITSIIEKSVVFTDRLNYYRSRVSYTPVYELLLELIDGEYGICMSASVDGKKKYANLNMLLKKAEDYSKTSYKGLFHFIRYIEMLRKYEIDYGEANTLDENDDTVRIMTIHKSKGLEFPVCFIAGMSKKYNLLDTRNGVIPEIDMGIGIDLVDADRRIKHPTIVRRAISQKLLYDTLAEEQRVLYVAMTRAREKLIMTGVVKDVDKALASTKDIVRCNSYLDLVVYALNTDGLPSVNVCTLSATDFINEELKEAVMLESVKSELMSLLEQSGTDDDFARMIRKRCEFVYPYSNEGTMNEKVSVTELKRRSSRENNEDKELPENTNEKFEYIRHEDCATEIVPSFVRDTQAELPANLHGSAVHRIYEIWDYSRGTEVEDIEEFFAYVLKEGLMEETLLNSVTVKEVQGFLTSDIAARMRAASARNELYREQPFVFECENMMIQGIIDAFFIENDEIVIVDYKTDRVKDVSELQGRYHVQLEYYDKALSTLLGRRVSERLIYSTRLRKTIAV